MSECPNCGSDRIKVKKFLYIQISNRREIFNYDGSCDECGISLNIKTVSTSEGSKILSVDFKPEYEIGGN